MSARCKGGLVIPVFFYKEHLTIDYSRRINDINATNNLDFICRYFSYLSFASAKHLLRRAFGPTKSLPRGEGFREGVTWIKKKVRWQSFASLSNEL